MAIAEDARSPIQSDFAIYCVDHEFREHDADMQKATHPRLHVRDAHDAHVVFEAVRQGFLHPVTRRLNEVERNLLVKSGVIFVWFECEDDAGLKRWTDGRVWGQSRMREPYLFYDEKLPLDPAVDVNLSPTFRFVDGMARSGPSSSALSHQERATNQHPGLVKQTYSAWVSIIPHMKPQKWHLIAYFTYSEISTLPTIDREPLLRKIIVPSGIYQSRNARSRGDENESMGGPRSSTESRMTPLPSLQSTVGSTGDSHNESTLQHRSQGVRLPEDHRVIQILNSRHIL